MRFLITIIIEIVNNPILNVVVLRIGFTSLSHGVANRLSLVGLVTDGLTISIKNKLL